MGRLQDPQGPRPARARMRRGGRLRQYNTSRQTSTDHHGQARLLQDTVAAHVDLFHQLRSLRQAQRIQSKSRMQQQFRGQKKTETMYLAGQAQTLATISSHHTLSSQSRPSRTISIPRKIFTDLHQQERKLGGERDQRRWRRRKFA